MRNYLSRQLATLRLDKRGQIAILMVMVLPVIFLLFALALDAGVWYLDHRLAQNQVDAAAMAAVRHLPAADMEQGHIDAINDVDLWITKNGGDPSDLCVGYPKFLDLHPSTPDLRYDAIRVCIRRESGSIFAGLANLDSIYVSATATARVGPVTLTNVMPWGLVGPDPDCGVPDVMCFEDPKDNDGDGILQPCGYYLPVPGWGYDPQYPAELGEVQCPWGLNFDNLYKFKDGGTVTSGNFGALAICGTGGNDYRDCIEGGATISEFFQEGTQVMVAVETGNKAGPTVQGLTARYDNELAAFPAGTYQCDIDSYPDPATGYDPGQTSPGLPYGKAAAKYAFVDPPDEYSGCEYRLVAIPILDSFPSAGSGDVWVLGIATFGIAGWDRTNPINDAAANTTETCGQADISTPPVFECGQVWGYLIEDAKPPDFLLQRISDTNNPLAPLLTALVE